MDEIKAQKKALKKAYKQAKRKNVLAWKILTILCAVVMVISVPLSVLAVKFDNTMAARFGGSFWKLQNEDTNAQYYTSDFNSAEEMVDYGLALTQQVEAEGAALLMNNNNALPLAADAKVSTFSNSSVEVIAYAPPVIIIALPVSNMQAATTPVLPKNACTSGSEKQPML